MDDGCEVDVVVLGGGVAGCWTARRLSGAGYSVALVTTDGICGGQTAHSHVYLHRGHLYRKEAENEIEGLGSTLVTDLQLASRIWDDWLHELPEGGAALDAAPTDGLFAFATEGEAAAVEHGVWNPLGLLSHPANRPAVFADSTLSAFRTVTARCLDASRLTSALVEPLRVPVIDCGAVVLRTDDSGGVAGVTAHGEGWTISVTCRAAVFTAGAGNRDLLAALPGQTPSVRDRSSFMLVITDPANAVLTPLSGVFNLSPDDSLFLVSRHGFGSATWLLSDAGHQADPDQWLRYICAEFQDVFPPVWARRGDLRWGYYEAPKAEVDLGEAFHREVHSFVVLQAASNVLACWPTKLTLAPLAAEEILHQVDGLLETPRVPQPELELDPPRLCPERWQLADLHSWPDFDAAHGLS